MWQQLKRPSRLYKKYLAVRGESHIDFNNDARGWATIRKVLDFESSCIVICVSYIYLIIETDQKLKLWARVPIAVSHIYR